MREYPHTLKAHDFIQLVALLMASRRWFLFLKRVAVSQAKSRGEITGASPMAKRKEGIHRTPYIIVPRHQPHCTSLEKESTGQRNRLSQCSATRIVLVDIIESFWPHDPAQRSSMSESLFLALMNVESTTIEDEVSFDLFYRGGQHTFFATADQIASTRL